MPPVHKPLKNDGPACRVCGCTEHNACVIETAADVLPLTERIAKAVRMPATRMPRILTCSWVETSGNDRPRWLCSACSGTDADLAETLNRIQNLPMTVRSIALAAIRRYKVRQELEKGA